MLAASLIAIFLIPVTFDVVENLITRGKKKPEAPPPGNAPDPGAKPLPDGGAA